MAETTQSPGVRPGRMLALAAALLGTSAGQSRAQFGYGGIGFGIQQPPQLEANMLNSWALNNGAAAAANKPQALTAPRFQGRDDGFFDRYDLATQESMVLRVARNPGRELAVVSPTGARGLAPPPPSRSTPRAPSAEATPGPPQPAVLLGNFFDRNLNLVWPVEAPNSGDMGKKQAVADHSVLAVLHEYQTRGIAQLSVVTEARQKLLDYGRPALDFVRKQSTPAIADSFHSFLLGLYAQVGLAATVPKAS